MLKYKQIWHGIKPTRWLIKFNLTILAIEFVKNGQKKSMVDVSGE